MQIDVMTLSIGDLAPDFTLLDSDGNTVTWAQFQEKTVVVYFYPRDNTPGCTKEACSFRDAWSELQTRGIVVLGVSTDSQKSHLKFRDKFKLPFTLISDPDHSLAESYGVWGEKKFMGKTFMGINRKTFIVNPEGQIEYVFDKVNTDTHALDVLKVLQLQ